MDNNRISLTLGTDIKLKRIGLFLVGDTFCLMLLLYDNMMRTSLLCVFVSNFKLPALLKCHYVPFKTICLWINVLKAHAAYQRERDNKGI